MIRASSLTAWLLLTTFLLPAPALSSSSMVISQPDVRRYNLRLGKKIFWEKCVKCHGDADTDTGAPQLGVVNDWQERLGTPLPNLIAHALNGHGKMPPKGGFKKLSDRQVSAAVAYVLDQGRRMLIAEGTDIETAAAQICREEHQLVGACDQADLGRNPLMQMLFLITRKNQSLHAK